MTIREFLEMATNTTAENIVLYNHDEQKNFYEGKIDALFNVAEAYPETELTAILQSELQQWDVCDGKLNINFDRFDLYDNNPELLKGDLNKTAENKLTIEELWEAVCCGYNDKLAEYYENGGAINRRYNAFGLSHSLMAGAYRNGNINTVKLLWEYGECPEEHEIDEICPILKTLKLL